MSLNYRLIEVGNPARVATYIGYLLLVIIFLFGLDYGNADLALIGIGSAFIGFVGQKLTDMSKTLKDDTRSASVIFPEVFKWVAISMAVFVFLDAFVPHFFSITFVGIPVNSVFSTLGPSSFFSIGLIFTEAESVMEELLCRGGVTNLVMKYTRVPIFAFFASGFFFGVIHIPAYGLDMPILIILGSAGVVFAVADYWTQDIITSMIAHALNNFAAWFATASAIGVGGWAILSPSPLNLGALGLAVAIPVMGILAVKRHPSLFKMKWSRNLR